MEEENIEIHQTRSRSEESICSDVDSGNTTDSSMLCETDEDEELTGKNGLSEYVRWNSHRNCWTVCITHRGNDFFVGNFHSKKHAINALIDYSNQLSIPLSDYFYSPEVEESIGSPNYYTTDSDISTPVSEDEVIEDKNNSNSMDICSPAYPVSMKLWALAGLCISRGKQKNNSSREFVSF